MDGAQTTPPPPPPPGARGPRKPRVFKEPSGPVGQYKFICCGTALVGNDRPKLAGSIIMFGTFFALVIAFPAWDLAKRGLWVVNGVSLYFVMCCAFGFFTFFFLYLTAFRDPGIVRRNDGREPPPPPPPPGPPPGPEDSHQGSPVPRQEQEDSVRSSSSNGPLLRGSINGSGATSNHGDDGGDLESGQPLRTIPTSKHIDPLNPHPYCYTCRAYTPARSAHCSICDCCVRRLDHHCKFVGTCIGERNYRYFFIYLGIKTFSAVVGVITTIVDLVWVSSDYAKPGDSRWKWFAAGVKNHPGLATINFACLIFCLLWAINLAGLWIYHIYLVSANTTTRESIKQIHKHGNPYDKGCLKNYISILGARIGRSHVWDYNKTAHIMQQRSAQAQSSRAGYSPLDNGTGDGGRQRRGPKRPATIVQVHTGQASSDVGHATSTSNGHTVKTPLLNEN